YEDEDKGTKGAVINALANGKSPLTADTNSAVVAWEGAWDSGELAVLLQGKGDAQLWLVGQGDVSTTTGVGLQFVRGLKQGTINVPASHPGLLAVGCTINRITWTPFGSARLVQLGEIGGEAAEVDSMCYFSSAGPTPAGYPKPEISAPGGFVVAAMSRDADPRVVSGGLFNGPGCPDSKPCYMVDERHAIAAGTSMSAPQVSGAVALLFQRDPNLTQAQVTEILQAGAGYPTGRVPHPTQLGPGELDLRGADQVLATESASGVDPAIDRSWYVLSSAYARPDPAWPVWGTIELRRADGTIAGGLDGTKLSVSVTGGSVVKALSKVRHGLFRFAVAAPRGSAGTTMTVDVLYDGVSLGARELPIGTDAWTATGEVDATSAAGSCAAVGAGGARGYAALGLAAAAASALRRRRRAAPVEPFIP
ncbi:MAG: S8 family serine peptidase, partial [Polyangiaceae bacterium]|nr:S8 family serine peptidase [Polyangiaceae bacterium]